MAGKTNPYESVVDKTSFFFVGLCGVCHPGGGPGEFDRDGYRYYDTATGRFGYELSGRDPTYDGDYAFLDPSTGSLSPAPWDVTGLSEPDCLYCHRRQRTINGSMNMNWIWRAATLRGGSALVDSQGATVPAHAAAPAAGQGWFSSMDMAQVPPGMPPKATMLQIDYTVGVGDGSLIEGAGGEISLVRQSWTSEPKDYACWGCHAMADGRKRGQTWFDGAWDVHYAAHNKLNDADPGNDIPPTESTACTHCHIGGLDHSIAKGNAFSSSVANEADYQNFRSCRDCHLAEISPGVPNPLKDPDAPEPVFWIHTDSLTTPMMVKLSCQACHLPYAATGADLVVDNAVTGSTVSYGTDAFLSADPLNPADPDKSRWYPAFLNKTDSDGVQRLFPAKILLSVWWADWDQSGTPGVLTDDVIAPIPLWKVRQVTSGAPLSGVTDDNGDGQVEVNRLAEINTYIQALKGNDSYGRPIAANPVLIRGGRVWYEDLSVPPENVNSFAYEGTGIAVESTHPFSMDHNILPSDQAWGVDSWGSATCHHCHRWANGGQNTVVMDRLILTDPFGPDGVPVYQTLRTQAGVNPP